MSEKPPRIFIGNGRDHGKYSQIAISVNLSKIPKEHTSKVGGDTWGHFIIGKPQNPKDLKKPYYVEVNTWKPDTDKKKPETPKKPVDGWDDQF